MIDDKTSGFTWPLPHAQNLLSDDVERLRTAFGQIDQALTAEQTARQQHASAVPAHAATAITVTPAGDLTATTVQAALAELDAAKAAVSHAHAATAITVTPAGNLTATTVQGALAELDSEKLPLINGLTEIDAALTDADELPVYDASSGAQRKSLLSRVWTYIQGKITGAISGVLIDNLVQNRAVVTDANGKLIASATVSATELGYLDGVTSALQTQLNGKASASGQSFTGMVAAPFLELAATQGGEGGQLSIRDSAGVLSFFLDDAPTAIRFVNPSANPKPMDFITGPGDPVRARIMPTGTVLIGNTVDDASGHTLQVAGGTTMKGGLYLGQAGWGGAVQGLYLHQRASGFSEPIRFLGADGVTIVGEIGRTNSNSLTFAAGDAANYDLIVKADGSISVLNAYQVNNVQVLGARRTGWTAATGSASRAAFATNTVTTEQLAQRFKALLDDLIAHGLIG